MRRSLSLMCAVRRTASIIPVPMNLGQPNLGLDQAPSQMIAQGLPGMLGDIGWGVKQAKAVVMDTTKVWGHHNGLKNCEGVGNACKLISDRIFEEYNSSDNTFPLILGGDHAIAIGTISGLKRKNPNFGIVWVDAHADINTPEGSDSGNMHGKKYQ
jgi:arginase